jgi:hypothetical protein
MTDIKLDLLNISEFKDIIEREKEDSLRNLTVNTVEYNNEKYKIIKYEKALLTKELMASYGLCRSIIINNNKEIISFAPPKSIDPEIFIKKNPIIKENIIAEEFVEGTMINLFWNKINWEITTRNIIGANTSFIKPSKKTFREMFFESVEINNIQMNELDKKICYSFVLQHPENKIVLSITKPQLYLVGMYGIDNKTFTITSYNIYKQCQFEKTGVKLPKIYKFETYSELIKQYASMNSSYAVLGVIIYDTKTGERCKFRNPVYEEIKILKGNQPKLQYQYLCLRKEGKVGDFLKYFPENKDNFSFYRDVLHLFTNTLFTNYIACYIKKEKPLLEYPEQYRTHMFTLHQIYIKSINNANNSKFHIDKKIVIDYVNNLHPSLLMYCLNYHMRKRNIDIIISEKEQMYHL